MPDFTQLVGKLGRHEPQAFVIQVCALEGNMTVVHFFFFFFTISKKNGKLLYARPSESLTISKSKTLGSTNDIVTFGTVDLNFYLFTWNFFLWGIFFSIAITLV